MTTYSYYVKYDKNDDLDKIKFEDCFDEDISDFNPESAVEKCADNYYCHHDGCEDDWPITILLFDNLTKEKVGIFKVEMEMSPIFYAEKDD